MKAYTLNCKLENVEIRKVEDVDKSFKNKKGETVEAHEILLACDDENEDRIFLHDKNMENLAKYKRGMIGTFKIRIDIEEDFGMKAKITVVDFQEG